MTDLLKSKTVSGKTIRAARRQILVIGPDTKICPHILTLKVTFFIQFFTDLRISYRLCNSVADLDLKNS